MTVVRSWLAVDVVLAAALGALFTRLQRVPAGEPEDPSEAVARGRRMALE
jgi:hypothetical protein